MELMFSEKNNYNVVLRKKEEKTYENIFKSESLNSFSTNTTSNLLSNNSKNRFVKTSTSSAVNFSNLNRNANRERLKSNLYFASNTNNNNLNNPFEPDINDAIANNDLIDVILNRENRDLSQFKNSLKKNRIQKSNQTTSNNNINNNKQQQLQQLKKPRNKLQELQITSTAMILSSSNNQIKNFSTTNTITTTNTNVSNSNNEIIKKKKVKKSKKKKSTDQTTTTNETSTQQQEEIANTKTNSTNLIDNSDKVLRLKFKDLSLNTIKLNESLRWHNDFETPEDENVRIELYKLNRRKRYIEQQNLFLLKSKLKDSNESCVSLISNLGPNKSESVLTTNQEEDEENLNSNKDQDQDQEIKTERNFDLESCESNRTTSSKAEQRGKFISTSLILKRTIETDSAISSLSSNSRYY